MIAVSYEQMNVGKHIKSSKKRNIWKLLVDGNTHTIELYASKFSGKKTLKINNDIKYIGKNFAFDQSFMIDSHKIALFKSEKGYTIKVNDIPFNKLCKISALEAIPKIIITPSSSWTYKAKPFRVRVTDMSAKREQYPIKPCVSSMHHSKSRGLLEAQTCKPRTSSLK